MTGLRILPREAFGGMHQKVNYDYFEKIGFDDRVIVGHFIDIRGTGMHWIKGRNVPVIIGVRDPRDQMISQYYYAQKMKNSPSWQEEYKLFIEGYSREQSFAMYMMGQGEHEPPPEAFYDWYLEWTGRCEDWGISYKVVKYEDLLTESGIDELARFLDHRVDPSAVLEATEFGNGNSFTTRFEREGCPGAWEREFEPWQKDIFKDKFGYILKELGYE
jgi:hypothetical protein